MLLGEILRVELIKTNLRAADKFAAIDELLALLVAAKDLPPALFSGARNAVVARETSMPTGMELGIALPHAALLPVQERVGHVHQLPEVLAFQITQQRVFGHLAWRLLALGRLLGVLAFGDAVADPAEARHRDS